jgi:hypothetical protein
MMPKKKQGLKARSQQVLRQPPCWRLRLFAGYFVHIQRRSKLAHSKSFAFDHAALAKTPALPVANRWKPLDSL